MYRCSNCGATMRIPLDRCPSCGALISGVKCGSCGYVGGKTEFITNGNRCPRCNTFVSISPGPATRAPRQKVVWTLELAVATAGVIALMAACVILPITLTTLPNLDTQGLYIGLGLLVGGGILAVWGIGRSVNKKVAEHKQQAGAAAVARQGTPGAASTEEEGASIAHNPG